MACFCRLYRIDYEKWRIFLPKEFERRVHNGGIIINADERDFMVKKLPIFEQIERIPCGKCIGCRLSKSRDWANRCMLEAKEFENNCFLTLTYDDAHLPPFRPYVDVETGEVYQRPMLVKKDLSKFMKLLRQKFKREFNHDNIRFFGCGEYGEKGQRPHFHVILFNCDFPDKKFYKENPGGKIYTSEILSSVWTKGIAITANVSWHTCAYVARYTMKKAYGEDVKMREQVLAQLMPEQANGSKLWQDEFVLMSRKPGIGRKYFELHKDTMYVTDEIYVKKGDNTIAVQPSKYYDKLFDVEYPTLMEHIKQRRKINNKQRELDKLSKTSLTEDELLASEERAKLAQSERLIRPLGDI